MLGKKLAAVAVSALLLFAGACGQPGDSDRNNAPDRTELEQLVASSGTNAKKEGSARVFVRVETPFPEEQGGGTLIIEGPGVMQFDPPIGRLIQHFDGTGAAQQAAQLIGKQEAIIDGATVYMRSPVLSQQLGITEEWLKMDLQAIGEEMGLDFSQLIQGANADPSSQLDYLTGATQVEKVGTESVRGVPTTHYRGVLDFELFKQENPEAGDTIDQLVELSGTSEAPFEVWLDDNTLPARYAFTIDYSGSEQYSSLGKMDMTLEYFDWGVPVDIEVPTEAFDLLEFMREQEAQQG